MKLAQLGARLSHARIPASRSTPFPQSPCPALRTADDEPTIPPLPTIPGIPGILPEGEAIVLPPPDITPNDPGPEAPTRIPHLGHALLFLAITGVILFCIQLAILLTAHPAHPAGVALPTINPKLILFSEAVTYLLALGISWLVFPRLWHRPFLTGIQWNAPAAARNAIRLVPLGIVLSVMVQAASSLISMPKSIPMDDFFRTRTDIWLVTAFGILVAPLFEEITFRGFFLPAFAIAYDWLCLPRTEAARASWNSSNAITLPALVFSAVFTSILFALLHGKQTAFTWPVLVLLFGVSLILTTVRLRLRSVAASTLVHASYNFTIFAAAFIATGGYRHLERLPR